MTKNCENTEITKTEYDDQKRSKKIESFACTFRKAFHNLQKLDHCESTYGTGISIHSSEIHHLEAIKKLDGAYVTLLAEEFEVTKGAVSQILMKLESKELIYKSPDPLNKSRKLIFLTELGEQACKWHEHIHRETDKIFIKIFNDIETDDIDVCLKFVNNLNAVSQSKELMDLFT